MSQKARPSTSARVYPHASTANALTSRTLPSGSRIPAKIPDWLKTDSNFAFAAASASSDCLREEMSRMIFDAPVIRPEESLIGEIESDTSSGRPSLVSRTVS